MGEESTEFTLDASADVNTNLQTMFTKLMNENRAGRSEAAAWRADFDQKFTVIHSKVDSLNEKYVKLDQKHKELEVEVLNLKAGLSEVNQKAVSNEIFMNGVPEMEKSPAELNLLVAEILNSIDVKPEEIPIVAIKRIGNVQTENVPKPRSILVSLGNEDAKNFIIVAKRKKQLDLSKINFNGAKMGASTDKVFINENLSQYNALLYSHARNLVKIGAIKFAWINKGQVLIREVERAKVERIKHEGQLVKWYKKGKSAQANAVTPVDTMDESDDEIEQPTKRQKSMVSFAMTRTMTRRRKEAGNSKN